MTAKSYSLHVQQVNCFYNYTVGLDITQVDLVKTASKLLKSGIARTVCFSDLKALYLDSNGEPQLEWIQHQGRQWDDRWVINFSESLPKEIADDLIFCLELSFNEQRIVGLETKYIPAYLRAALPPLVLERGDLTLPIYPWLKLHSDGVMTISFQLDTTWQDIPEENFIDDIVNLFQRYFDCVWVQAELQRMDFEQIIPDAFEGEVSIGGQNITDKKARKVVRKMRQQARDTLEESLSKEGHKFELHGESWALHKLAGSEDQNEWEATFDLCRSIYASAITSQVVVSKNKKGMKSASIQLWNGRPSISLMRFADQPELKSDLFEKFGPAISRILMRSSCIDHPPELPPDLRPHQDYCLHGNRSLMLWTWLRSPSESDDAWEDKTTRSKILENQARAEHFEYHNMRVLRACAMASSPKSNEQLVYAYEALANSEAVIHQSSQVGEITDAVEFLLASVGTTQLVGSGKEQARWHLDERRFRAEKHRSRIEQWLAIVFGFVGTAGLADLIVQPLLKITYLGWDEWFIGLIAFLVSSLVVGIIAVPIWIISKVFR